MATCPTRNTAWWVLSRTDVCTYYAYSTYLGREVSEVGKVFYVVWTTTETVHLTKCHLHK